jgi:hypothetical protein
MMSATGETNLDGFLSNYKVITTITESVDIDTTNVIERIKITVEQKRKLPQVFISRGVIPYKAPSEDYNLYTATLTGTGEGITYEYANFYSGLAEISEFVNGGLIYDLDEVRNSEHRTIGYLPGGSNMYGAFKVLYDNYGILQQYPTFYTITGGNLPYAIASFTGVTEKGSSAGTYTLVNFANVITPVQLMFDASTIGLTHSNGLPTGTSASPAFFGLSQYTGVTQAVKSMYFVPDMHFSLRRNLNLYLTRGIEFDGIMASFEPHYQFLKNADDDYLDSWNDLMNLYNGNTANPAWTVELLKFAGTTSGLFNRTGYQLVSNFNDRFFREISTYPKRFKTTKENYRIGQYGVPYSTSVLGWSSKIPTPGTAIDATGPFASINDNLYLNRIAGLTLYPPPSTYNYLGPTGATSFGGSGGSSGWNSYHKSLTANSGYHAEYFMLGGTANAIAATYEASKLIPANILTLFTDTAGPVGLTGTRMNFLDSYFYDLYQETMKYSSYNTMNVFPMEFVPRFNPLIPVQSSTVLRPGSRRDCTIHPDFGGNTAERLYNLKESMKESIHSSLKMWKLLMDQKGKFNYRILPVIRGRSEDLDLTRGGSVPYDAFEFIEYIVRPLFDGEVPANGLILQDDVDELLYQGFYLGNIARGAGEYTKVVTNGGVSGSDRLTSFIRGLETYFFDLKNILQSDLAIPTTLSETFGFTGADAHFNSYKSEFNSGRFSDYRVYETNTGNTGGNSVIPYGYNGTFNWNYVPLRSGCVLKETPDLLLRWTSDSNNNIKTAYEILRDAYFQLTKDQILSIVEFFKAEEIDTFPTYSVTDTAIGR